jgi:hypothetical protein
MADRRRGLLFLACATLLALELSSARPRELAQRWRVLRHYASESPETRRFAGGAAAFDRDYFVFLNSVRRQLPGNAKGVALFGLEPSDRAYYLAVYWLAPTPALSAPARVPPGWVAAVYGAGAFDDWGRVATVYHGAIFEPSPP